jgi:hypothetical protein
MISTEWPHHLLIEGTTTGGSQSADGDWIPGATGAAIYDGKCDAQEPSSGGIQIITSGEVKDEGTKLEIYLEDESKINDLDIGMMATLTRGERTDIVKVKKIKLIDGMIEVDTV